MIAAVASARTSSGPSVSGKPWPRLILPVAAPARTSQRRSSCPGLPAAGSAKVSLCQYLPRCWGRFKPPPLPCRRSFAPRPRSSVQFGGAPPLARPGPFLLTRSSLVGRVGRRPLFRAPGWWYPSTMRIALCQLPVSPYPVVNRGGCARPRWIVRRGRARSWPCSRKRRRPGSGTDLQAVAEPLDGPFGAGLAAAARTPGDPWWPGCSSPRRTAGCPTPRSAMALLASEWPRTGTPPVRICPGETESKVVAPGAEPVLAELAGLRVGLLTCYDIRFPARPGTWWPAARTCWSCLPAWAAGLFKEEHWVTLVRARAIENRSGSRPPGRCPTRTRRRPGRPLASAGACWWTRWAPSGCTSAPPSGWLRRRGHHVHRAGPGPAAVPGAPARGCLWPVLVRGRTPGPPGRAGWRVARPDRRARTRRAARPCRAWRCAGCPAPPR